MKLYIAVPCYGGLLYQVCANSLLCLQRDCMVGRVGYTISFGASGEALIPRARNRIVAAFLATDATHLLMIDADMAFDSSAVLRMVASGHEVCGGIYPGKGLDWQGVANAARRGVTDPAELQAAAARFIAGNPFPDAQDNVHFEQAANGGRFVEVEQVGAGCLMVLRTAIEKLIARFPELRYERDGGMAPDGVKWCLFDPILEGGTYLPEDWSFCRRWRQAGGKIWAYLDAKFVHVGAYNFSGDPSGLFGPPPPR